MAETALAIAREKADARELELSSPSRRVELERLGRRFETVLDCGLFHTFDGDERPGYVASLASVTEHDGTLYVLCFSDIGPDTGPHPVSEDELKAAFKPTNGWSIAAIKPDRILTRFHDDDGAPAWLRDDPKDLDHIASLVIPAVTVIRIVLMHGSTPGSVTTKACCRSRTASMTRAASSCRQAPRWYPLIDRNIANCRRRRGLSIPGLHPDPSDDEAAELTWTELGRRMRAIAACVQPRPLVR